MIAPRLLLIAPVAAVLGWASLVRGDNDVTVVSTSTATPTTTKKTADTSSDGTPVVHKSSHKKKKSAAQVAATNSATSSSGTATPALTHTSTGFTSTMPRQVQFPPIERPLPPAPANMLPAHAPATASAAATGTGTPSVETALPVGRYPGIPAAIPGVSTYQPPTHTYIASNLPAGATALATTAVATYTVPSRPAPPPLSDFDFVTPKANHNIYPWRTYIVTTEFWIGEGATPISSTTNVQSSWDEEWLQKNHGTDSPYNRNGYASGGHASTLNPFYCALPFNDLAFPDKAQNWLPHGWYRHPEDGKQVSACQHRWVEIKNSRGDICYAQWEDVGPLTYDDAEYVFGGARPRGLGSDHAGLDVSPAVFDYLGLNDRNRYTAWKFVDEADVRPGAWLKLDEQAVIFTALEQLKNRPLPSAPIQRSSEPIDDANSQSNKKKIESAN
jgi:hypothetical protein